MPPTFYNLISTSTPAGRSSFIRASTVLSVGSMMSIRRRCVRISNWSRELLLTWGERSTSKRSIDVGAGALGRFHDLERRLVDQFVVKRLQADADFLVLHY